MSIFFSGTEVARHRKRGGARISRGRFFAAALILCMLSLTAFAGCGSNARTYAQKARSSYISARAVLVGVEEYPSQMEMLLRSGEVTAVEESASRLIDDVRDLLPTASSAFRTVGENCELLAGEDSEKFDPYADMLLELKNLNEQVINSYSEFIGLSSSVLQGLPYGEDPATLMPTLDYMDEVTARIRELSARIAQLEEETEAFYLEIK